MRILLFGSAGQVGWELQRSLAPLGEVTALCSASTSHCGDLAKPREIAKTVRELKPDVIVNASAYTAVDKAESEPDLARLINAETPGILAAEAAGLGAWVVHYSTDYVFDGSGNRPWLETDAIGPLNVYGKTKRQGEESIQSSGCRSMIFRTSWVYSAHGKNFARTMLGLAREKECLRVIDDQVGVPTGADLIADVTALAIRSALESDSLGGLYHLVPSGETTWHGYASFVLELAREAGMDVRANEIIPIATSQYPSAAPRPLNSRLDTQKLRDAFDLHLPEWRAGVRRLLSEILP